ncbi:MAG: 2OG-Fe(II) oxygenase, partial [Opitutaceae bacterium]
ESVRKVWQIAPERLTLRGAGWERSFAQLEARVAADLGCDAGKVRTELYKLLIYDEGGFFAAHRDTEKAAGMFGTLVVSLPSSHEGGDLIIRHAGRETVVDLRASEAGAVRYAAFYADCEHEVRPVTAGYRVCLVYNIVSTARSRRPVPPDHRPAVEAAAKVIEPWAASDDGPHKLVYLLEHQYTQAALSFSGLKGEDAARAAVLKDAAERAGCALHLAIVHIEESGWAEFTGDYHSYRSRRYRHTWEDEEEEEASDDSDFEVGEVCDGRYYLDQWRDAGDRPVRFGEIPLGEGEVLPAGALDGEKPDGQHFSEATGNEGASFERTYLRAALVLWPQQRFDEICASGGFDAAIARLGRLISDANASRAAARVAARERVSEFARLVPLDWAPCERHGERLTALLGHFARFKDAALIESLAPAVLATHYDGGQNKALLSCARVLGPARSRTFFADLFQATGA